MTNWAVFVFDPGIMAGWVIAGMAVGLLVCQLKDAPSYGVIGDVILGALGGVITGTIFSFFGESPPTFWTSTIVALVGAGILVAAARIITSHRNA